MKSLILVFTFLFACTANLFASDWFDLIPSRSDTLQLYSDGKDTSVTINFNRIDQTFTATLILSYQFEYYSGNSWISCNKEGVTNLCGKVKTPTTSVNAPYKPIGITIMPKSKIDTLGFYRVRINAENGPKSANCLVYFRINPSTSVSRFYQLKGVYGAGVDRLLISYDTSVQTPLTLGNPSEKWECVIGNGASLRKLLYQNPGIPYSFSIDRQKNFWWANFQELYKIDGAYRTIYTKDNSEYIAINTNYNTHHFAHLTDGTTFVGNREGLYKINEGLLARFPANDSALSRLSTNSIAEYNDTVWVASSPFYYYSNTDIRVFKYFGNTGTELPSHLVNTDDKFVLPGVSKMKNDKNGNLWAIASIMNKGMKLLKFDGANWMTFPALDSTNADYQGNITEYVFDNHGKMWLLTSKKSLIEFDGESIGRIFDEKNNSDLSLVDDRFLLIDSLNTIYLSNRGVLLFNPDGISLPSIAPQSTTGVDEPETAYFSGIFPQPAKDYVTFDLPSESQLNSTTIEVVNSTGNNVSTVEDIAVQTDSKYTLPVSDLGNGLYFVVIRSGNVIVKKPFVVVR